MILRWLLLLVLCCTFTPAMAQSSLNFKAFERMPILDNGRVKPIGAYAKTRLKDFYVNDQNATQWLAETLFNPSQAINTKIFAIKNQDLKTRLKLDENQTYFNLQDLEKSFEDRQNTVIALLNIDQNDLTKEQKDLLKLHEDIISYHELLRSFSLILPIENDKKIIDLLPKEQQITKDLQSIIANKGQDISTYTQGEQETALIAFQLQQIREGATNNDDFKIIPSAINLELTWAAPWQIINDGKGTPQTTEILSLWEQAASAYRNNDAKSWDQTTRKIYNQTMQIAGTEISQSRLNVELLYQNFKPYHLAMALYAISIILLVISISKPQQSIKIAAFISITAALISHAGGIAARIYILDRPPVGTLYESVLFVSLICALIGLIAFINSRKPILPLTAQIAALCLLSIAPIMLQSNDSLELLVAVLNTNFWLATHVLCITAGYGVCILVACLSHVYMILRIKNTSHPLLEGMFQSIHKIGLIALLLTAVGTVLGGIWADQSWGRFWGWDPKENGALLIVLWLIWIQHGRLSGNIRPLAYIAGMAGLNIVVALAWFGVNLLGVGLHSYGFTSGLASGLAVFCVTELILILSLWAAIRIKEKKS